MNIYINFKKYSTGIISFLIFLTLTQNIFSEEYKYKKSPYAGVYLPYTQAMQEYLEGNYISAEKLFRTSAKEGNPKAMFQLGKMCFENLCKNSNANAGTFWIKEAANLNNKQAKKYIKDMVEKKWKDDSKDQLLHHEAILLASAQLDNSIAMFKLGRLCTLNECVSTNQDDALIWLKKSAEQNYEPAQAFLIQIESKKAFQQSRTRAQILYEQAQNAYDKKQFAKAYNLFERSSKLGNKDAIFYMGKMHVDKKAPSSDVNLGYEKIKEADHLGSAIAKDYLNLNSYEQAIIFYREKKYNKAFRMFRISAKAGNTNAMNNLGVMYLKGLGTTINKTGALFWYQLAAKKDNKIAQYNLGTFYEKGDVVTKDLSQAIYYYKLSAKQDYIPAQLKMAKAFYYGKGVRKNTIKAYTMSFHASLNRNKDALTLRDKIYASLSDLQKEAATETLEAYKIEREERRQNELKLRDSIPWPIISLEAKSKQKITQDKNKSLNKSQENKSKSPKKN